MNKTLGWKIVFGITFGWWLCAGMMAQTTDSITYWNAHTGNGRPEVISLEVAIT